MMRRESDCILCGDAAKGRNSDKHLNEWASRCAESLCGAFRGSGEDGSDYLSQALTRTCAFCDQCLQITRDLDYVVRVLARLEKRKAELCSEVRRRVKHNFSRIAPAERDGVDSAVLVRRLKSGRGTMSELSYEQVLKILHYKFVENTRLAGDSEEPFPPGILVKVEIDEDDWSPSGYNDDGIVDGDENDNNEPAEADDCGSTTSSSESSSEDEVIQPKRQKTDSDGLKELLVEHQTNVKRSVGFYRCKYCQERFDKLGVLKRHTHEVHVVPFGKLEFECDVCTMVFESSKNLDKHREEHETAHPFKCLMCRVDNEKIFTSSGELRSHVQMEHYPKELNCYVCSKPMSGLERLRAHIKKHRETSKVPCQVCSMLICRTKMKVHVATHSAERNFVCTECGKTYRNAQNLKRHMVLHIAGKWPYKCSICGRRFRDRDRLNKHEPTHKSKDVQSCYICNKSFDTILESVQHQSTHGSDSEPETTAPTSTHEAVSKTTALSKLEPFLPSLKEDSTFDNDYGNDDMNVAEADLPSGPSSPAEAPIFEDKAKVTAGEPLSKSQNSDDAEWSPINKKKRSSKYDKIDMKKFPCTVDPTNCSETFPARRELGFHIRRVHQKLAKPYDCTQCIEEFESLHQLQEHRNQHHLKKDQNRELELKCSLCEKVEVTRSKLMAHFVDDHDDGETYPCNVCYMIYSTIEERSTHESRHLQAANPFSCVICKEFLSNTTDLRRHVEASHYPKHLRCSDCSQVCFTKYRLHMHRIRHKRDKLQCLHCDYESHSAGALKFHMRKHSAQRSFICSECGQAYKNKRNLTRHMMNHTGVRRCKCRVCGRGFKEEDKLKRHEKSHLREKIHTCFNCKLTFKNLVALQSHQPECPERNVPTEPPKKLVKNAPTDPGDDETPQQRRRKTKHKYYTKPEECSTCGMRFTENGNGELEEHVSLHVGRGPFDCVMCEERFANTSVLKRHVNKAHVSLQFICDVCGASFYNDTSLGSHMKYHTKEKWAKCPECPYSSPNADTLADHMAKHRGEKLHTCETCGDTFQWRRTLAAHRKKHAGIKSHICTICGESFTNSGALKSHQRTHQGDVAFSCKICRQPFNSLPEMTAHVIRTHVKDRTAQQKQENTAGSTDQPSACEEQKFSFIC